jgi:hypothetical protein
MKSSRRLHLIVSGAVLLSLALGGCSFVDDAGTVWGVVGSDIEKQRKLASVASALERIEGVESASSDFTSDGPSGDEAQLQVTVNAATTKDQAWEIATVTHEAFTSVELVNTVPLLTLRIAGDTNSALTRSYFGYSDEQFAEDFAYWRAAETATGTQLSMALTPGAITGTYDRTFSAPEQVDAVRTAELIIENVEALNAVHDETQNPTIWEFAGMRSYPHLPPADLVELLDGIRGTIPLIDFSAVPKDPAPDFEYPEGVLLMWNKPNLEQPALAEIMISRREYRDSDEQKAIAAAALAASVPDLIFRYVAGEQQFQLHTSTCEGTVNQSSDDQKFFDAMLATGAEFLDGAGPGACIPER